MTDHERIEKLTDEIERLRARLDLIEGRGEGKGRTAATSANPRRKRAGSRRLILAASGMLLVPLVAWGVDLPYVFANGSLADANQVNANFTALEAAIEAHIADTTIHHPQLTSIDGLAGGTVTGNVTVTGSVTTPEVRGTPLRLVSPTTIDVDAGTVARVSAAGILDLNGASITLN